MLNIGVVLTSAIASWVVYNENMSFTNWIGIFCMYFNFDYYINELIQRSKKGKDYIKKNSRFIRHIFPGYNEDQIKHHISNIKTLKIQLITIVMDMF